MELRQLREEERRTINEKRKQKMIEAAFSCFCGKGMETTSIADVAREAEVGEATVYRYFSNKETLALACGKRFWAMAYDFIEAWSEPAEFQCKSGMEQVEELIRGAFAFYREHRDGFRLIHNLDGFLLSHRVERQQLSEYEEAVDSLRPCLCQAMEKGKQDGSIVGDPKVQELYYAVTTGIFSLMQKQAAAGNLLSSDRIVDSDKKLELFLELLIAGLKSTYGAVGGEGCTRPGLRDGGGKSGKEGGA